MANTRQAKKRAVQSEKHRQHNASLRSAVRTYIKKVRKAIGTGSHEQATLAFREAVPMIDRMAAKGIIPKNSASRYKSRLNTRIKLLKTVAA